MLTSDITILQNPESTVKEIYLCDRRQELITYFENAIEKIIKSPWFVFKHNRPCKQAPVERSMDTGRFWYDIRSVSRLLLS